MKIGDLVKIRNLDGIGGVEATALVIRLALKGTEGRVRFLKTSYTRWVITDLVEVISENR